MQGIVRASAESPHVLLDVGVGGGADHRGMDDEMIEVPSPRLSLELAHRRRLRVEHADRVACRHEPLRGRVVDGVPRPLVDLEPGVPFHGLDRVPDHGERAVSQEVHLH